jgi:hypothetical protein
MKHFFLIALCAMLAWQVQAQDDDTYQMYELIELSPTNGHEKDFQAAVKAHNDQFHKEGAESVNVWSIMSGPRAGNVIWAKGPLMWSDMDNEIEGDAHMDDWWGNVMQHSTMEGIEFWSAWKDMVYMPEDLVPGVLVLRTFDVHEQKGNNVKHIWESVIKMYKEKNWDTGIRLYWNQANAGDGRDLTIVWYHKNWSSMDVDRNFFGTMEEMYDIDRREFFENWNEIVDFKGMEIWTLNPGLSVLGSDD